MTSERITETATEHALRVVRESGGRLTSPTRTVIAVLADRDDHLTAEDLIHEVETRLPNVAPSTVYRVIQRLSELELIEHVHTSVGPPIYHLREHGHAHLVCNGCGTITDISDDHLAALQRATESRVQVHARSPPFSPRWILRGLRRHTHPPLALTSKDDVVPTDEGRPSPPSPRGARWRPLLLVAVGGGFGTAGREGLSLAIPTIDEVPIAIPIVNVIGAFLLGLLYEAVTRPSIDDRQRVALKLLLGAGFCGGFTTYSSLATDTAVLNADGRGGLALAYAVSTLVVGALATVVGNCRRHVDCTPTAEPGRLMSPVVFSLLSIAGAVGAGTRFAVDGWIRRSLLTRFQWATMIINLSGSMLLGLLTGLSDVDLISANWFAVLGTGFFGGYTTFSTASYETVALVRERKHAQALLSSVGMLAACVTCAAIGLSIGKSF